MTDPSLHAFYASVPSTVPVAYIAFALNTGPEQRPGMRLYGQSINETIGDVGSAQVAVQMVNRIRDAAEQKQCLPDGRIVNIPSSIPNLIAIEGFGGSRASIIADATVLAAKGPYVVNLAWGSSTNLGEYRTPPSGSTTPPLPSPVELESVVRSALAHLPS